MNIILVKVLATALAFSQATTRPEAIKTEFDAITDKAEVEQLLHAGCLHMRKSFDIEQINLDDLIATAMDDKGALGEEKMNEFLARIDRSMGLDANPLSEESWYSKQLGLTAPLRYNILFSVGSSLAFAGALLAFGWLKLRKIDF